MLLTSITKELVRNLSNPETMVAYLSNPENLNRWVDRQCLPCNGSLLNELITLARMIRG